METQRLSRKQFNKWQYCFHPLNVNLFECSFCINQQPDTTVLLENNNMVCSNILLNAIQIIMFLSHILEMKLPGVNFLHFFNFTYVSYYRFNTILKYTLCLIR